MTLPKSFYDAVLAAPEPTPRPRNGSTVRADMNHPYLLKAFQDEIAVVVGASEGTRNTALNESAFSLGQLIAAGMDESAVVDDLLQAALAAGLSESESRATIRSGIDAGKREPRTIPEQSRNGHSLERMGVIGGGNMVPENVPEVFDKAAESPTVEPLTVVAPPPDWRALELPARRFAMGHAFPLGCATLLHSLGGGGKSMLLLIAFVSMAIGRTLLPTWPVKAVARSLYVALEDDLPELLRRLQRIAHVYELTTCECILVAENLRFITPVGGVEFFLRGGGNTITIGKDFARLHRAIESEGPFGVLGLDPKSALLGGVLDENDNPTAQRVMNLLTALGGPDTAVVVADHVAKADRETSTSARGGGAWSDAARQVWAMRPINAQEQRDAGPSYNPALLVALELRKSNYTAPIRPEYLMRCCDPLGAGVLQSIDFAAARQHTAEQNRNRLRRAVLEVIPDHSVTLGELSGKHGTQQNRTKAGLFREAVAANSGVTVTCKGIASEVRCMIGEGIICTVTDPESRREVLRKTS